ncbi:SUF system Fe-S cluster assembly protein [Temperatibacter marinus]|uniref:SUF system Fe-S cluster assembly protein n=1 Tax=Temperatibacter marinus TaxID=1456591 RepID=A0AA52HAB0_9PROT|nr:SUF system Fe-S cluster assembly protein [Temperatibacter marinus]WND03774.1 SUF system Fe-S cluster assembly protein [Temperatibacter marinus]
MTNRERDILDLSRPAETDNQTAETSERPVVDPDAYDQTRDSYFLNRFMEKNTEEEAADTGSDDEADTAPLVDDRPMPENADALKRTIVEALREIYDPEIPVNIYEMGLIYEVNVAGDFSVDIVMTLTTPHCPVAETMPGEVEMKVKSVKGVKDCGVQLVWEPAWDMSLMSDEARLELGLL